MSEKEAKQPTRLVPHRSSAYENRRKYDAEFKQTAVKLSCASPKTIKEVAEDLGLRKHAVPLASALHGAGGQNPNRHAGRGTEGAPPRKCRTENGA